VRNLHYKKGLSPSDVKNATVYSAPFVILLFYLFIEYGRPQNLIPVLVAIHPGIIIVGLLCLSLLSNFKLLQLKTIQTKQFFMLLLLMTLHVPIAKNNYWAYQIWYSMIIYFLVFLGITSFVNSFHKIEKFVNFWILINLAGAVIGIKNGGMVPGSTFMGDENDFALVMNMAIPFSYFMFLGTTSKRKKVFYIIASGIFVAASVSSLSRGGFIGLIVSFLYCWYKSPKKLLGIIFVSLLMGVLFFTASDEYFNEIRSIKEENVEEGTGAIRWYYWKLGWKMFLDHPIIGVGQGNFPWNIHDYEPPEGFYGRFHGGRAAHSLYFTLIPELGTVGIILFAGILFYSLRDSRYILTINKRQFLKHPSYKLTTDLIYHVNKMKFIVFGLTGALLAYLITGAFLSVLYYPHFWLLSAIPVAIRNVTKKELTLLEQSNKSQN